jgi:hypothetical protein
LLQKAYFGRTTKLLKIFLQIERTTHHVRGVEYGANSNCQELRRRCEPRSATTTNKLLDAATAGYGTSDAAPQQHASTDRGRYKSEGCTVHLHAGLSGRSAVFLFQHSYASNFNVLRLSPPFGTTPTPHPPPQLPPTRIGTQQVG